MNNIENTSRNKRIRIFIILEIQIILFLVIIAILKLNTLDRKVYNTNKFVFESLVDKRIELLNKINDGDIVLGDKDAPVTVILYSRFDCSACNAFFAENFERLKTDFIDKGKVKLVVRYLVHTSKKNTLIATKCAYFANQQGEYHLFVKQLSNQYPLLDTAFMKSTLMDLTKNTETFSDFMLDNTITEDLLKKAATIRASGIRETPTLFVNRQRLTGNPDFSELERIILDESEPY